MNVLGIDVGGSGIKGALVDTGSGALVTDRFRLETPQPAKPKPVIKTIDTLVKYFDYSGPLGVGFPAIVSEGTLLSAANVSNKWIGYEGANGISEKTGCPVTMLNDADAAGIAEMRFGAGRERNGVVIILTLGTGIGSALFVDGKLVPNTELGHLFLRGQKRDVENQTSDRIRTTRKLGWKSWARQLDAYLQHLEFVFSPDTFVLGGGVSKKHQKFLPYLTVDAEVVPAQLRNEAGIVGAALAAAEGEVAGPAS